MTGLVNPVPYLRALELMLMGPPGAREARVMWDNIYDKWEEETEEQFLARIEQERNERIESGGKTYRAYALAWKTHCEAQNGSG